MYLIHVNTATTPPPPLDQKPLLFHTPHHSTIVQIRFISLGGVVYQLDCHSLINHIKLFHSVSDLVTRRSNAIIHYNSLAGK